MTDNEIKKRLAELRENQEDGYTTHLEYGGKRDLEQEEMLDLFGATLGLINRLQAENESLKIANKEQAVAIEKAQKLVEQTDANCRRAINLIGGYERQLETAKAEAYKEFAELVKANKRKLFNYIYSSTGFDNQIDNLLKEMVGGSDE